MVIIMIQINDKLRIRKLDDRNIVVEQLKTIEGKTKGLHDEWILFGYYGTLKSALKGCLDKQLFDTVNEELQLKDIISKIENVENNIKNMKIIEEE